MRNLLGCWNPILRNTFAASPDMSHLATGTAMHRMIEKHGMPLVENPTHAAWQAITQDRHTRMVELLSKYAPTKNGACSKVLASVMFCTLARQPYVPKHFHHHDGEDTAGTVTLAIAELRAYRASLPKPKDPQAVHDLNWLTSILSNLANLD
jgi:hypothetical protein